MVKEFSPAKSLVVTVLLVSQKGCDSLECGRYRKFVEENGRYDEIVAWADDSVFSRTIRPEDVVDFGLAGPGRNRLVREGAINYQPQSLPDVEIRLIGDDRYNPSTVFLGRASYKGLIVARGDVNGAVSLSSILPNEVLATKEHVALVCRPFR